VNLRFHGCVFIPYTNEFQFGYNLKICLKNEKNEKTQQKVFEKNLFFKFQTKSVGKYFF